MEGATFFATGVRGGRVSNGDGGPERGYRLSSRNSQQGLLHTVRGCLRRSELRVILRYGRGTISLSVHGIHAFLEAAHTRESLHRRDAGINRQREQVL